MLGRDTSWEHLVMSAFGVLLQHIRRLRLRNSFPICVDTQAVSRGSGCLWW